MCDELQETSVTYHSVPFADAAATMNWQRLNAPAGNVALIEIAPDSDIDACFFRSQNIGEITLSVKHPIIGPIKGDLEIRHAYQVVTSNTDAGVTRTILGDRDASCLLKLKVTYCKTPLALTPNYARSFKTFLRQTAMIPAAGTAVWEWPCHGRKLQSITLAESNGTSATVVIYGRVQATSILTRQDTLVPSFTLTASTTQNYQVNREMVDFIALSITGNGSNVNVRVQQWDD